MPGLPSLATQNLHLMEARSLVGVPTHQRRSFLGLGSHKKKATEEADSEVDEEPKEGAESESAVEEKEQAEEVDQKSVPEKHSHKPGAKPEEDPLEKEEGSQ